MKFFRLDLLTLLISLFILNSCKNQDTVGLGLNPSAQLNGSLVDTSTVFTNTVLDDTVATSDLTKTPLALFNDPALGVTEANIAAALNIPVSYTAPTGTVTIDSARLVMQYADGFYGDSVASKYTVNVYQLNERFNASTTYYNTKQWDYSQNVLGSLTFNARPHDSTKIYNIITGKPDTIRKSSPQIRIPISNTFINTYLFNAASTTLASTSIFQNAVKGLYITLDKTKTIGPGGIFMFKNTDTLTVYYRNTSGSTVDTLVAKLPISRLAAQVKHTYTATIQTELNNTGTSRPTVYLQGLAGLRAKISFPNLLANLHNSLLATGNDIVINRAELVITPVTGSDIPYRVAPRLTMYRLDLAHQRLPVEDANSGDARSGGSLVFGGFYNPNKKNYHFIVTAYMQDLLNNRTTDFGTYIAPADTSSKTSAGIPVIDINPSIQTAARTAAGGGANKTLPYTIKLNIIYTKVKK